MFSGIASASPTIQTQRNLGHIFGDHHLACRIATSFFNPAWGKDLLPDFTLLLVVFESTRTKATRMNSKDANDRFLQELNAKLEKKFIGRSEILVKQLRKLVDIAQTDLPVMVLGETGTGKELCARAIHLLSRRAAKPFHALNCANFSTERFESELFGH